MGMDMGTGMGLSILPITCCLLWSVVTSSTVRNNSKPWLFRVESDAPGGAQRVQTILLHTKDHYHLEPRARASTFGSAPFLIYSHLVFLDLISMLQAHRAPRVSAPPPTSPPSTGHHVTPDPGLDGALSLPTRPLTRLLFHHVGAVLRLLDFCYTYLTLPPGRALFGLLPGHSLGPGPRLPSNTAAKVGVSQVESNLGVRCSVLCSALLSLLKIVCVSAVQLRLSSYPYACLCARAAATAAWASTVVCGIAALLFPLPS